MNYSILIFPGFASPSPTVFVTQVSGPVYSESQPPLLPPQVVPHSVGLFLGLFVLLYGGIEPMAFALSYVSHPFLFCIFKQAVVKLPR